MALAQVAIDIFGLVAVGCTSLWMILVYFTAEAFAIIYWSVQVINWELPKLKILSSIPQEIATMQITGYWGALGLSILIEGILIGYLVHLGRHRSNSAGGSSSSIGSHLASRSRSRTRRGSSGRGSSGRLGKH